MSFYIQGSTLTHKYSKVVEAVVKENLYIALELILGIKLSHLFGPLVTLMSFKLKIGISWSSMVFPHLTPAHTDKHPNLLWKHTH